MHLSFISDAYISDVRNDAAPHRAPGRAYREALVRGVAAIGIAGILLGLTFLSSAAHSAAGGSIITLPAACARISARTERQQRRCGGGGSVRVCAADGCARAHFDRCDF